MNQCDIIIISDVIYMKKSIVMIIVGIVIISIISIVIITLSIISNSKKGYTRPNYDYVALIYHSEMLGMDAGTEYTYYIYKMPKSKNKYFYIKSKSSITITGPGKESDVGSGAINNKKDLNKIIKDIEKDSKKNSQTNISYSYVSNGNSEKLDSINELGKKLFK